MFQILIDSTLGVDKSANVHKMGYLNRSNIGNDANNFVFSVQGNIINSLQIVQNGRSVPFISAN